MPQDTPALPMNWLIKGLKNAGATQTKKTQADIAATVRFLESALPDLLKLPLAIQQLLVIAFLLAIQSDAQYEALANRLGVPPFTPPDISAFLTPAH